MNSLTKQEQTVLWVVLALLLTGLAVKTYRAKHPDLPRRTPAVEPREPQSGLTRVDMYADTRF